MEYKQEALTKLTVERQEYDDCIDFTCFGAAQSLSVKWQLPKQFQNNKLSMAMKNMVRRKPAAEIGNTYCDTVSECNMNYVTCK